MLDRETIVAQGFMKHRSEFAHTGHTIEFIQVLRGLAAMAVVILHAGWEHADYRTDPRWRHILSSGIAGVDLFFVISGFIMYCTIPLDAGGWRASWRFAIKRFSRIWPPYAAWTFALLLIFLCVPAGKLLLPFPAMGDVVRGLLFLPTSKHFFAPSFTLPVLDVGWTLYYEAYFYAVLAICLCCGRWKWWFFVGWLGLVALVIPAIRGASLFNPGIQPGGNLPLFNTLTSPIMWEFAAGVAIGWIYRRGIRFPHVGIGIAATALAAALLVVQCVLAGQILHGLSDVGAPIVLIVLALALTPANRRAWKPLLWLGKVSFSLYLAHKPVILLLETLLSIRLVSLKPPVLVIFVAAASILSMIVAGVSYRLLEAGLSNRMRDMLLAGLRLDGRRKEAGEDHSPRQSEGSA